MGFVDFADFFFFVFVLAAFAADRLFFARAIS
jgi:hypothetical protein